MRFPSNVLAVASVLLCSSAAFAAGGAKICGMPSGESLATFDDSNGAIRVFSNTLAVGIRQLTSFPEFRDALEAALPGKVCVSAIAMGKDGFTNDKLLVTVAVRDDSGKTSVLPLTFQMGSVQEYESFGRKPWLGFSRKTLSTLVKESIEENVKRGARFSEEAVDAGAFSPVDVLAGMKRTTPAPIRPGDEGYVFVPDVDAEWTTFLVSRLVDYSGNNFGSEVGVVQVQGSRVRSMPLSGFYDKYVAMVKEQADSQPESTALDARAAAVKRLSE